MIEESLVGFPPTCKLRQSREFDVVFKQNTQRISRPECLILALHNDLPNSRLGMVISKRNTPTSVNRNRIKRVIREAFRHARPGNTPMDIVVLSRTGANRRTVKELRTLLDDLFASLLHHHEVSA